MAERRMNFSPIKWFGLVILIIVLTNIAILLDTPVLRQISGFIFLTFIPGFLLLFILKMNKLGLAEKIALSLGLSVAFAMFFGLAVNGLLLAIGYTKPLSTIPLLISFSMATIILAIVAYIRNRNLTFSFTNLKLTTKEKAFLIVPSMFPLLSIIGMRLMEATDNNLLLMVLLLLIPTYIIFISFFNRKLPDNIHPSIIWLISISLLLMLALRSNHVIGSDIHDLYYLFQLTLEAGRWGLFTKWLQDANLSISLLPTIYQALLNMNAEYLFKILYPLLFSISPVAVYIIAKKYIGRLYSLLASFLFISQVVFLWTTGASTTNMAILFFTLTILVLFHQDIGEFDKRLLFIIFAASSIVSHYSTSYVFFLVLLFTWLGMQIIPRILPRQRKVATPSENPITGSAPANSSSREVMPKSDADTSQSAAFDIPQFQLTRGVTTTILLLFFIMLFFWYSQITVAPFNVGLTFIRMTFVSLNQAFLVEVKGPTITAALGEGISTPPQQIRVVVSWLTVAFIAIGVLSTVARYKRMVSTPQSGDIKPDFLGSKFETEYFVLALVGSALLVISVALPYISVGYGMERIFFQMLTILSPFFIIGGIMVAKWLRARPHWIILPVLIPLFMCTTGTMYQLFGIPASIILNSAGREYTSWYVYDQDSYAAKWLEKYGEEIIIYTGAWPGRRVLASQGKLVHPRAWGGDSFVSRYQEGKSINGYLYLRYLDIIVNRVVTEYADLFAMRNKIYTTDVSEIYR